MHILGIYSESQSATLLEPMLRSLALSDQVVGFNDADRAATYLIKCRREDPGHIPDLIILDFALPHSGAARFLSWLRREPGLAAVPVFALRTGRPVAEGKSFAEADVPMAQLGNHLRALASTPMS